jgi:hypothetical protein
VTETATVACIAILLWAVAPPNVPTVALAAIEWSVGALLLVLAWAMGPTDNDQESG